MNRKSALPPSVLKWADHKRQQLLQATELRGLGSAGVRLLSSWKQSQEQVSKSSLVPSRGEDPLSGPLEPFFRWRAQEVAYFSDILDVIGAPPFTDTECSAVLSFLTPPQLDFSVDCLYCLSHFENEDDLQEHLQQGCEWTSDASRLS
jgi:hypothetical protein